MGTETELKLLAAPAELERLRRLPWLRAVAAGRPRTRILRAVYFDTPDGRLRQAGVGLRLRDDGRTRIQTLKTAGEHRGGTLVRGEWESRVDGNGLDPAALAATPLAPLFDEATVAALRPLLRTVVTRTELRVTVDGATMLVAFDRGEVVAGRRRKALCEVEVEMVDGPDRAMFDLARRLAAEAPLAVGAASKLETGMRLLAGGGPAAARWSGSPLRPGMTAARAFQAVGAACAALLARNAEAVQADGAPEAVHQARVALRRLRSAIGLFRPLLADPETAALKAELGWLQRQLGALRDLDVFRAEVLAPVGAALPDEPSLALLDQALARRRRALAAAAVDAVRAPRFTLLMLDLGAWLCGGAWLDGAAEALDEPVEALAARFVGERERKLRKRLRRLADATPQERHDLRIQVKKLRYGCDLFLPVLPEKRARRAAAALGVLQDRLGLLNDLHVATATLADLAPPRQARLQRAAGLVEGWHAARAGRDLRAAEQAAADWLALPRLVRAG